MNRVFVDTDVILDLLAHRLPHYHFSALLFTFADMKKLEVCTSPTVLVNTFYILRKQIGIEESKNALRKLRLLLHIVDSDDRVIDLALNSNFSDFEDAVQCYTVQEDGINTVVTRNIKDYKTSGVLVQTPEVFLSVNGFLQ